MLNLYDNIIAFLFLLLCTKKKMNRKVSRNKKHKYSNKEKLSLVENGNTSGLINIAQEDDNNDFELLQNLGINDL